MAYTKTQLAVLRQAVADGGSVVMSGIDKHPGWNKRHVTAAIYLHSEGLGLFSGEGPYDPARFDIWPSGRRVSSEPRNG